MEYKKFEIIEFDDNEKLIVLETINYEGTEYLYVDKVNEDETETLEKYRIMKVLEDGYIQKETDTNILMNILPLFSNKIKLNNE